jgi:hypothetical protein
VPAHSRPRPDDGSRPNGALGGERRSGEDDDGQSQADDGEKARADGEFCLERRILLAERRLQGERSGSIGAVRLSTDALVFLIIAEHDPVLSGLAQA